MPFKKFSGFDNKWMSFQMQIFDYCGLLLVTLCNSLHKYFIITEIYKQKPQSW